LIFVHGGGFIGGNKRDPNATPFYDNIMLWAAKNGFVGVNIDYRLAPASTWPAVAEDLGLAVQWVVQNIAGRGGDPARVFLMGHSAGAAHVASYVSHPGFFKVRDGGLKGAIMVSGLYELSTETISDPQKIYFGSDPSHYAERSAMQGLAASKIPLMIATAEFDPPIFGAQFNLLKEATCKGASGCPHALVLPQHNHMSEVYSINTADERLTSEILAFTATAK
jgi:triacylglycerol lipase